MFVSAASPGWAHAFLTGATPPVGSEIAAAPALLTLRFGEPVEPRFSTIELRDTNGASVQIDAPLSAPGNAKQLTIPLPALSPGVYTVIWHATSVDTHRTEGRYQFTIRP